MAVLLTLARGENPPPATGTRFTDVPANYWAARFIEQLAADGVTSGCGGPELLPRPADHPRRDGGLPRHGVPPAVAMTKIFVRRAPVHSRLRVPCLALSLLIVPFLGERAAHAQLAHLVKDLNTTQIRSLGSPSTPRPVSIGPALFFAGDDGGTGLELWKLD